MFLFAAALLISVFSGYQWSVTLEHYYKTRANFDSIDPLTFELSLFSENGFYYSFYKNVALADSNSAAVQLTLADARSEAPDTINALQRFNVWPEIIVGALYRLQQHTRLFSPLLPVYPSEADFYLRAVFAWSGVSMASIFLIGFTVSGSLVGGALSAVTYAANYKFALQVQWSPPLRECWALPCLHILLYVLVCVLRKRAECVTWRDKVALGAALVALLVPWQFTAFLMLAHSLSLYCVVLAGLMSLQRLAALFRVYAVAYVVASALLFGQLSFFHSFSFCFICAVLLLEQLEQSELLQQRWKPPRNQKQKKQRSPPAPLTAPLVERVVGRVLGVAALFVCVLGTTKLLFDTHTNAHVGEFMRYKFAGLMPRLADLASGTDRFSGGGSPSFAHIHDFDTLMYVCQSEFDFMPIWAAARIFARRFLTQKALASLLLVAVACGVCILRKSCDATQRARRAAELFLAAQAVSFAVYAIMVERFAVLAVPVFAMLVSILCSVDLFVSLLGALRVPAKQAVDARLVHQAATLAAVAWLVYHNSDAFDELRSPVARPTSGAVRQQADLMRWIDANVARDAAFAASMPLASAIKLTTNRRITMHPQYESAETRRRIKAVYQMYGLRSLADVHALLKDDVQADYFVLENDYCNGQLTNGCMVVDMVDEYRHHKRWSAAQLPCVKLRDKPDSDAKQLFAKEYANQKFVIYKLL